MPLVHTATTITRSPLRRAGWVSIHTFPILGVVVGCVVHGGCKPATETEYPYGVSPPTKTIIASGPLPTPPQNPTSDEHQGPWNTRDAPLLKSDDNAPERHLLPEQTDVNKTERQNTIPEPTQVQLHLPSITGRQWRSERENTIYFWELRENGFFEFRRQSKNLDVVQRMGTYRVQDGRLIIQFRETITGPDENGAPKVHQITSGTDNIDISVWSDGRLRLDQVWYTAE